MSQDSSSLYYTLFLEWTKEWWDVARERNSKGVTTYKRAYDSLKANPIPFEHPSELRRLKWFGEKLCDRLTQKLQKHCEEHGLPMPDRPEMRRKRKSAAGNVEHDSNNNNDDDEADNDDNNGDEDRASDASSARPAKKARKPKAYVPALRSGPYALILALATLPEDATQGMTKADLIAEAQQHCDASFTVPSDPTKFYTAWSSMKALTKKDLVYERGNPLKRYMLTKEGRETARKLEEARATVLGIARSERPSANAPDVPARPPSRGQRSSPLFVGDEDEGGQENTHPPRLVQSRQDQITEPNNNGEQAENAPLPSFTPLTLPAGSYTVELVLDMREVRTKRDRDYMQEELAKRGVQTSTRSLELGDAVWVARPREADWLARHGEEGEDIVLDYIMERKRLDDLVSSIKDGRFKDQKFRLGRAGARNVIYLVESISMDQEHYAKYEEAVLSAMASTQVVDGFFLKRTDKMDDTLDYLARLTRMLQRRYQDKPLCVIPTNVLTPQNYLRLLERARESEAAVGHYLTYEAFMGLGSKSQSLRLRDVFLKMLMCTRGVTGEKAIEMQRRWRTPYDFVKAYAACGDGEEGRRRKIDLVASQMSGLVGRGKIAKILSHKIAEVWGDVDM